MDSAKAKAGKEAWEQMIRDGVIEEVKAGTNTDWSSALHLAPKAGGGARPCTDFRALNDKTICDAHPLPLLKDFTNKIHGSKVFSVIDLRSAFFNVPIWPPHRHKTLTLSPWGGSYIYNRLAFGLASGPSLEKTKQNMMPLLKKYSKDWQKMVWRCQSKNASLENLTWTTWGIQCLQLGSSHWRRNWTA